MRTFDYRRLPQQLFDGKVGDANVRLYEDKGKLELLEQMHPAELAALRERAHFDNVDASTRIEGLYVDGTRVRDLIAGAAPLGETEAQIIGYSNALKLIEGLSSESGAVRDFAGAQPGGMGATPDSARFQSGAASDSAHPQLDSLDLSTASILKLYEALYAHRDLGRKSRYRKKDYLYVQVDGHMQAMPVSPITAFETPLVLGGACDSLADAFNADACSPLILNAVFTVDFLCIRPFDEGNGRISRLFSNLLLEKSGFTVFRYLSVDRLIEESAMDYYNALNACVEGWDRGANSYVPYALYWLEVVHEAYRRLFEAIDLKAAAGAGGKSERVRLFVEKAGRAVTKREIREALPDVSEATVENALGKMVKAGEVEKLGAGRSTAYRWR